MRSGREKSPLSSIARAEDRFVAILADLLFGPENWDRGLESETTISTGLPVLRGNRTVAQSVLEGR